MEPNGERVLMSRHSLGVVLGNAVVGGLVGYITVWLAPANKPKGA